MNRIKNTSLNRREIIDVGIFAFFAVISFILFNFNDLLVTAQHSYAFLNGNISDFYTACYEMNDVYAANYLPLIFALFAVWNIPLKLLGITPDFWGDWSNLFFLWNKLLPVCFYLLSARLLYSISLNELEMGKEKSRMVMYMFLTAPVAFFSQFIFGQYDIFCTFMILMGTKYYLKQQQSLKNWLMFILCFGVAVSFKYYAVLIFIVFLLLRTKNVWKIFRACGIVVLPCLIQAGFYLLFDRYAFMESVFGFSALEYASASQINIGFASIQLIPFFVCIIAAASYFTKPRSRKEEFGYVIFYSTGMCFVLFSFMTWHPQWFLMAVPFWILATCIHKNPKIMLWIELLFFVVFLIFVVNNFENNVDQNLLKYGVLSPALQYSVNIDRTMADIFIYKDVNILFSILAAIFAILFLFNHPRFQMDNFSQSISECNGLMNARFCISVLLFLVPALSLLPEMLKSPEVLWKQISTNDLEVVVAGTDEQIIQYATIQGDSVTDVYIDTWTNENPNVKYINLIMKIYDVETGELINESMLPGDEINPNGNSCFEVRGCKTEPGKQYKFVFCSDSDNLVPVYIRYGKGKLDRGFLYDTVQKDYSKDYIEIKNKSYIGKNYNIVKNIFGHYKGDFI